MNPLDESGVSVVIPCFRDSARAIAAVNALARQMLPEGMVADVVVVDDGSGADHVSQLRDHLPAETRLVALPRNRGRSEARNEGARAARFESLLFLDADCLPCSVTWMHDHHLAIARGAIATSGPVEGIGNGFWSRYQRDSSARRECMHRAGLACSGSSQNMAVRRSAFLEIGGFDAGYIRYGFEDRDLLARLSKRGYVAWVGGAPVAHTDDLRLPNVLAKLEEAGQYGSRRFREAHPGAYATLGYAWVDCSLRPSMRIACAFLGPLLSPLARVLDPILDAIPYAVSKSLVRSLSALAYCNGTCRSE